MGLEVLLQIKLMQDKITYISTFSLINYAANYNKPHSNIAQIAIAQRIL
jgi:hypothetical protein